MQSWALFRIARIDRCRGSFTRSSKTNFRKLKKAGIKIWMLTWDKIETAILIALSSRLLSKSDQDEMAKKLGVLKTSGYNALVIDGISLYLVIENYLKEFIKISKNWNSLVGCRYSPSQKATMARALKKGASETICCIGDGVTMFQWLPRQMLELRERKEIMQV